MKTFFHLAAVTALAGYAAAQTFTDCDPTKKDCPADPALGTEHEWWFNSTIDDKLWDMKTGTYDTTDEGATFSIAKEGESTLLVSNFYIFFGVVESHVKMAKGGGVVSSVVLQSDDLDEIDWEWIGNNVSEVQSNFFGKGNDSTFDRGGFHAVANADTEFHNYTTYWAQDRLEWWIDENLVRTLKYDDSKALGGKNYPQTPSRISFSNWPAGRKGAKKGTIEWAGGLVDYDNGPHTMTVQRIRVKDFHSGKEYSYGDRSGSFGSIKVAEGNSTAQSELNKVPPETLAQKWEKLGTGAHVGVFVGAAAVGVMAIGAFLFFCLRQRSKGRLEHALDDTRYNEQRTEAQTVQNDWKQSEWRNSGYRQVS